MTKMIGTDVSRRALLGAFASAVVVAAPVYSNAFGLLRGAGDVRKISLRSGRTGETLEMVYWVEGKYIKEAIQEIDFFMRDWREDAVVAMAPRNMDILAASHRLLKTKEPYLLLSGYRTPGTNALLRRHSSKVAKNSLHMQGKAADIRLSSRSVHQIAGAALACNSGGVGKYSRSNFVHMDCGAVRTWGR